MKRIVVNDTNVFIDLMDAGLLDEFFRLPWEIHTTDFVMLELLREGQKETVSHYEREGLLQIDSFEFQEVLEVTSLQKSLESKTNLSLTDCSVWHYAKKNDCILLTGDRKLRSSALRDGVEVRGILFVFDSLVCENVISQELATEKLTILKGQNLRLPHDEIEKRLNLWSVEQNKEGGSL